MKRLTYLMCFIITAAAAAQQVAVTIYNQDLALIREVRQLEVAQGTAALSLTDVAARIDPTSVHCSSLSAPGKFTVLEQNYEFDLADAARIMQKYIDHDIRLITAENNVFEGRLLSTAGADIVLGMDDGKVKIIKNSAVQYYDLPGLPQGLVTRPTLNWLVRNQGPEQHRVEIDYLTSGISWHAEYVGVVSEDDGHIDLTGWVSIENNAGKTFRNAVIKLIAGDVNLVSRQAKQRIYRADAVMMAEAAAPQFEEKEFFEYHMYTLQRPADVKDRQIKQLSLFPVSHTPCKKVLHYDGSRYGKKVRVQLEFENRKKTGLGMPLPAGKVRLYKADSDASLQFIGEDLIDHTPRDETLRLLMGNAFDVVGERRRTDMKKISDRSREETYEISLRNHKKEDIGITVTEHAGGDWKILSSSHTHRRKDAGTFEFIIPVSAGKETVLTYTIFIQY